MTEIKGNILAEVMLKAKLTQAPVTFGDYTITVVEIANGHEINFTKGGRTETVTIMNGKNGDPFRYSDFTPEQLAALKGEPFRFSDFTPEQLESLHGKNGESPSAKVTQQADGAIIEIEDVDGKTTAIVKDGKPGSDAAVTPENIKRALGYDPADAENVPTKEDLSELGDRVTVLENEPKVPETVIAQVDDNTRQIDAIKKLSKGIIWDFQTDSADGDKVVPTGGKQASVLSYGGKSVAWNQLVRERNSTYWNKSTNVSFVDNVLIFTPSAKYSDATSKTFSNKKNGHRYYMATDYKCNTAGVSGVSMYSWGANKYSPSIVIPSCDAADTWYRISTLSTVDVDAEAYIGYQCNAYTEGVSWEFRRILYIDLTQLFGSGNEPATKDDPRIAWIEQYATEHPEYNAGEIISADVESVTFNGSMRGLLTDRQYGWMLENVDRWHNDDTVVAKYGGGLLVVYPNNIGTYIADVGTQFSDNINTITWFGESNANNLYNGIVPSAKYLSINRNGHYIDSYQTMALPQKGTEHHVIPSAIRQLDGYGWSAGTARNYIEQTDDGKWLYHKQVERLVIPEDTVWYKSGEYQFYHKFSGIVLAKVLNNSTEKANAVIATIPTVIVNQEYSGMYTSGIGVSASVIYIGIDDYNARSTKIDNQPFYYELETEVITDITALMGDALDEFEVKSGGSITFDNAAKLSVPNSVQYFIALNEVIS